MIHTYRGLLLLLLLLSRFSRIRLCATPDMKKNEIMLFSATWIDLEIIMLNKSEKDIIDHLYVESKEMIQMKLFAK